MAAPGAAPPDVLVDTSVAVPLVVADHPHHRQVITAVGRRRLGLSGHAAFETFSVLTRLPPPARRGAAAVERIIAGNFPASRFLDEQAAAALAGRLGALGIAGGSVYDALVGAAAALHRRPLLTRDAGAVETYRALDVDVELLG
ncbi:MAG TPA: type II toxin-antitoxin system VapC family toxin [Acidimicrobiales bacterium]|nr:type II toxin-antitoxin system VapC family toxin [Acidimicrobiales bacterium]